MKENVNGRHRRMAVLLSCAAVCTVLLGSCSDIENHAPLYVYGLGLDKDAAGFKLYALVSEDGDADVSDASHPGRQGNADRGGSSGGAAASENGGNAGADAGTGGGASGSEGNPLMLLTYGGKTPEDAFESFFAERDDVYTGSLQEYLWGESLDESARRAAALYLLGSSRLPLKRPVRIVGDPYGVLRNMS